MKVNQVISVDQVPEASIAYCKSPSRKMVFSVIFTAFIFIIKTRFLIFFKKKKRTLQVAISAIFFIHFIREISRLVTLERQLT